MCRRPPHRRRARRSSPPRTTTSDARERCASATNSWASRLTFAQHEPDAANGVNQFERLLDVDLAAQARDVDVDHVVEGRRPRGFLPYVARKRLTRHDLTVIAHQVFEQLELTYRELDRLAGARDLARHKIHFEIADRQPRG